MRMRALITKPTTNLGLSEQAFWRVPLFTEWIGASCFEGIFCMAIEHSSIGTSSSGTSGPRWFSLTLPREKIRRRIWWWTLSTLIHIVAETAIVSFHTLPVGFPLSTISKNSLYTLFFFLDSWPRRFSHNFHFWRQNSYFVYSARYFFSPSFSICDNQVLTSSDESPGHTIPIRSWVSQTLVFLICEIFPRYHQMRFSNSVPFWIEFLNIIILKNHWLQWPGRSGERPAFHEGNGPLSGLFCSSRLILLLKWVLCMILFSAEAILASSTSKFGIEILRFDDEDLTSSTESTNSTSLIHCIASVGKCEQVHTSFLNLIFPASTRGWCGEFVEMKIQNLQSLLVCRIILWRVSLTRD